MARTRGLSSLARSKAGIMPLFDVRFFLNDVSFTPKRDVNQYDNDSLGAFSVITINRSLIARA
jgi:hypothetical protein